PDEERRTGDQPERVREPPAAALEESRAPEERARDDPRQRRREERAHPADEPRRDEEERDARADQEAAGEVMLDAVREGAVEHRRAPRQSPNCGRARAASPEFAAAGGGASIGPPADGPPRLESVTTELPPRWARLGAQRPAFFAPPRAPEEV